MRLLYAFLSNVLFFSVFLFLHDSGPHPAGSELGHWGGALVYAAWFLSPLLLLVSVVFNRVLRLSAQLHHVYLPRPWMGWGLAFLAQLLGAAVLFNALGLVPPVFLLLAVAKATFDVCCFRTCAQLNPLRLST